MIPMPSCAHMVLLFHGPLILAEAGFASWEIRTGIAALSAVLLLSLAWIVFRRRRKTREGFLAEDIVTSPDDVRNALRHARNEGNPFELTLLREGKFHHKVGLKLVDIGPEAMTMELPGFLNISADWKGKTVECSFSVTIQRKNQAFYYFRSMVVDIRPAPGFPSMTLSLPELLELRQKRDHLRLEPPSDAVVELALRPISNERIHPKDVLPTRDKAVHSLPQTTSPVRLLNISAGGARLELRPNLLPFPLSNLRPDGYIALSLTLADREPEKYHSWYMVGRIRNLVWNKHGDTMEMGLRFSRAGEKDANSSSARPLHRIEKRGVEGLGRWIFQRHLELYRQ
jgi:hypothetical protein